VNNFDQQKFATHVSRLFIKPHDSIGRMVHASMGVSGEAGELLDAIKKTWIYGKQLDRENILEECGDALFYIQALLTENGFTMGDAAEHNYAKLAKRYPAGYTDQAAQVRADKLEQRQADGSWLCDGCQTRIDSSQEKIETATHFRPTTLCRTCYNKAGNSVR
jgi:NTP pyrophosphatase (non-canonical NTP hydrolase)